MLVRLGNAATSFSPNPGTLALEVLHFQINGQTNDQSEHID